MVHIRGHITEQEWKWLKDTLEMEGFINGTDIPKNILAKISTNEEANNGKVGTVTIQAGRV